MNYRVLWRQRAAENLFELTLTNPKMARRVLIGVRGLGIGSSGDFKKLKGVAEWRLRVGDWRVAVYLDGPDAYINEIHNRRDAYD